MSKATVVAERAATVHVEYWAPFDHFLVCLHVVVAGELAALWIVRNSFMVSELDLWTGWG